MTIRSIARIALASCAAGLLGTAPLNQQNALNAAVYGAMRDQKTPGAQVAVSKDGTLAFSQAFGLANAGNDAPATADSQFEIGSVTKQFTAAAILQLKEQGKLRLSDPLGTYVPEYSLGKNVTIEQLLWQVSGIPDYLDQNTPVSSTPGGLNAVLAMIAGKPLQFAPGTQWRYSNTNYYLLGVIVARVSGMPYERYIRKNIFERAGMTHSAFVLDEPSLPQMATGYAVGPSGEPVAAQRINDGWAGGAGAIVSTASDVIAWDDAFFGGKIVSPSDVTLATTPDVLPSGDSTQYGFGWGIRTFDGQPLIWHNGGSLGFISQNDYFPKQHEAIVALTNDRDASAAAIADRVFETLHPQLAAAAQKPAAGENPRITALARTWLQMAQAGRIDRSAITPRFSAFLTPDRIEQAKEGLAPLGAPTAFTYTGKTTEDGVTTYTYRVRFKGSALTLTLDIDAAGKIAGLGFQPA